MTYENLKKNNSSWSPTHQPARENPFAPRPYHSQPQQHINLAAEPETDSREVFDLICSRPLSKPNTIPTKPDPDVQLEQSKGENSDLSSNGVIQRLCSKCESELNESAQDTEQKTHLQTKLSIGAPGDKYEQQADTMAANVMSIPQATNNLIESQNKQPEDSLQRKPLVHTIHPLIQRQIDLHQKRHQPKPITTSLHPLIHRQTKLQQKQHQAKPITTSLHPLIHRQSKLQQKHIQRKSVQQQNPTCRATNRRAGLEHELIQKDYIFTKDPTGVREYSIPGGSGSGRVGYADIVSLGTHAIYEIKPYSPNNITSGLAQVNRYLQAAKTNCNPKAPWHLGFAYRDTVLPMGNGRQLVAKQYGYPGLILYYTRQQQRRPVRAPKPVTVPRQERQQQRQLEINWENVFKVVVGLGLSVALVATVLYALISPEPATKLAAAGLSAAMIVVILNHFGIQDSNGKA